MLEKSRNLNKKCYTDGLGIIFEYTATGTPQQNVYVERTFPTIMGRARAMNSQQVKENNYGVRQLMQLPCLIIFWFMNRIVHHHTLCSMGRMQICQAFKNIW